MSVSLQTFIDVARQQDTGDVRFAKDSNNQELVNKGTFGNRVSTFFKDIKEFFTGADPTRATRQQATYRAFERALAGQYDQTIADAAMGAAGIRRGSPMTGAQIQDAVARASAAVALNNATRAQHQAAYVVGPPASAAFVEIAKQTTPQVMPRTFPPAAQLEFHSRFTENLNVESRQGKSALSAADVDRIALETLSEVHRLSSAPDGVEALGASTAARRGLAEAYTALMRDCADGHDPAVSAQLLGAVVSRTAAAVAADRNPDPGPDAGSRAIERALSQATADLQATAPDQLRRAHANALTPDSPLRAVTAAAQSVAESGGNRLDEARRRIEGTGGDADMNRLRAGAMLDAGRRTVNAMGRALGVDGATRSDHLQLHDNGMTPPDGGVLAAGRAALDPVLPTVHFAPPT